MGMSGPSLLIESTDYDIFWGGGGTSKLPMCNDVTDNLIKWPQTTKALHKFKATGITVCLRIYTIASPCSLTCFTVNTGCTEAYTCGFSQPLIPPLDDIAGFSQLYTEYYTSHKPVTQLYGAVKAKCYCIN